MQSGGSTQPFKIGSSQKTNEQNILAEVQELENKYKQEVERLKLENEKLRAGLATK